MVHPAVQTCMPDASAYEMPSARHTAARHSLQRDTAYRMLQPAACSSLQHAKRILSSTLVIAYHGLLVLPECCHPNSGIGVRCVCGVTTLDGSASAS
eukprot:364188-Chlamydomonas_euryale.AAC.3